MHTRKLAVLAFALLGLGAQAQNPPDPAAPFGLLSTPVLPELSRDVLAASPLPELPAWTVTARDEVSTTYRTTRYLTNTLTGEVTAEPHGVVVVENGLNYPDEAGVYRPSQDLISALPEGGFAARHGLTKLYCGATLDSGILLVTKSGQALLSRPAAIGYYDPAGGTEVPLAEVRGEAKAEQVGINRLLFRRAFVSELIEADLRVTYCKAGIECDTVITRQPLLSPEECGLGGQALLQVSGQPLFLFCRGELVLAGTMHAASASYAEASWWGYDPAAVNSAIAALSVAANLPTPYDEVSVADLSSFPDTN
jgi:hypothetical protein